MTSRHWLVLGALGLLNCLVFVFLAALVWVIRPTDEAAPTPTMIAAVPSPVLATYTPAFTPEPPTPTIPPEPTATNTVVLVPTNTALPVPTATHTPVAPSTVAPTNTPVVPPTEIPTNTPVLTAAPTNTPVPQHQWTGSVGETYKNCGSTGLLGFTLDSNGGLAGDIVVHYWTDGWEGAWAVSSWSNKDYNKNWDGLLDNSQPRAGTWYACVVSSEGSWDCLSNQVAVDTSGDRSASPQWVQINFRKN